MSDSDNQESVATESLVGFIAVFFSESMRRDAMSGMSIVLVLENERHQRSPTVSLARKKQTYSPGIAETGA